MRRIVSSDANVRNISHYACCKFSGHYRKIIKLHDTYHTAGRSDLSFVLTTLVLVIVVTLLELEEETSFLTVNDEFLFSVSD